MSLFVCFYLRNIKTHWAGRRGFGNNIHPDRNCAPTCKIWLHTTFLVSIILMSFPGEPLLALVLISRPSSRADQDLSGPLQQNATYCDQCFCYVCDKQVSMVSIHSCITFTFILYVKTTYEVRSYRSVIHSLLNFFTRHMKKVLYSTSDLRSN